ncbi:hypothetical protein ACLOJK_003840 [Asimina triloba]
MAAIQHNSGEAPIKTIGAGKNDSKDELRRIVINEFGTALPVSRRFSRRTVDVVPTPTCYRCQHAVDLKKPLLPLREREER